MDNNGLYINDQITKIGGAKKFLDFKDSLNPANVEDYAMLHGEGGKKHARLSTIKLAITDYSQSNTPRGKGTTYVQANVPPALVEILREKCLQNMGTDYAPNTGLWPVIIGVANAMKSVLGTLRTLRNSLGILFTGLRQAAGQFYKNADARTEVCTSVGNAFAKAVDALRAPNDQQDDGGQQPSNGLIPLPVVHDYAYSQVRVNMYDRGNDNKVAVSQVNITRMGYRPDGTASRYPWTIQISQFRAMERVAQNGTSSYEPKTISDKIEASISVTDESLFTATTRVCHFIEVWENAVCIPIVREGLNQREQARQSRQPY